MAALTNEQLAAIANAYAGYCTAHHTTSIPVEAWKTIIDQDLYRAAVSAGYWGAPGTVPGIDYTESLFTGVQGTTHRGKYVFTLFKDGEVVAVETTTNPNFDTVAFAAAHGVKI